MERPTVCILQKRSTDAVPWVITEGGVDEDVCVNESTVTARHRSRRGVQSRSLYLAAMEDPLGASIFADRFLVDTGS